MKYYVDTCIWRDYFENRSDKFLPIGEWAFGFFQKIIKNEDIIVYSELVEEELLIAYNQKEIESLFSIIPKKLLEKAPISTKQIKEAHKLSVRFKMPYKDALHYIIAKDNFAILITRDNHFLEFSNTKKPEELI